MAAISRLASSRRTPRGQRAGRKVQAAHDAKAGAPKPLASGPAPAPVHPPAPVNIPPGWSRLDHIELPQPTYWPSVLALGITFLAWGLVTTWLITVIGLILFAVALAGWIGDLRHGH